MTQDTLARTPAVTSEWLPKRARRIGLPQLIELYRRSGPFATVYLGHNAANGDPGRDVRRRWADLRDHLQMDGASDEMLQAVDGHLDAATPPRTGCVGIIAAQDGYSVVDHDIYPPASDRAVLTPLPELGHLLEWQQRKIPTLVITAGPGQADIAGYAVEELGRRYPVIGDLSTITRTVERLVRAVAAELLVVVGRQDQAGELAKRLAGVVPVSCRVAVEGPVGTVDDLALVTLRQVGIAEAGITLRYLREQRFLSTHGAAVDGVAATVRSLASGEAKILLAHIRRRDDRTVWVGPGALQVSLRRTKATPYRVPLVDGLIRSAVLQRIGIRIVPSLGPSGPDDDLAAVSALGGAPLGF